MLGFTIKKMKCIAYKKSIDEVELHLHPRWQKHLVGDLLRTFPNTQFVITTHSLVVIEAVNNHLKREQLRDKEWELRQ